MTVKKTPQTRRLRCLCAALLLPALLLAALSGCGARSGAAAQDVLSQKVPDPARTRISVLVKYAFSINAFEAAVEEKFPNIDLVQVGNYTHSMGVDEYARRLEKDDLTDIVMTWPLDVGEEYWADRLLDLSGMEFTNRYNLSMLNTISRDGALYYVPGPSQVRGIVYNKTLFEENGWQLPQNFEEFITLCHTIEKSGMRALQLGFQNKEVLDTAFVGFSYADCFSKPQDTQWIGEYNEGRHSFGDHFGPALETFQRLLDEDIFRKSDLEVGYAKRETMLFTRQCAMTEDSVLLTRMGKAATGTTDEYALMPFFNPDDGEDWARIYMVCFIGLNKHLVDPGSEEKYELVLQLMDYTSTPEGQEALMADTGAMFSSLKGVSAPTVPETAALTDALNSGRYAIFPELQNAQNALRNGLAGMVRGDTTKETMIRMVDAENLNPPLKVAPKVLGTAEKDFTLMETGNYVTDAMRARSGCDIALFLDNGMDGRYNGKGISGKLYEGEVTQADVQRILPDMKQGEEGTLCMVTMTGADLLKTLEYAIPVDNNQEGWFYYFSGLKMTYSPTAEPGSRIQKIKTSDGKDIDLTRVYSIAVMDETLPEDFLLSHDQTVETIASLLERAISEAGVIAPSGDGRFTVAP